MIASSWLLSALLVVAAAAGAAPSSPAAKQAVADATGAALQADVARSLRRLAEVPPSQFSGEELAFRSCMDKRFGRSGSHAPSSSLTDPFARKALTAFEPRIDVLDLDATSTPEQPNLMLIRISYRVRANNAIGNLVYPFYIREGA